MLYYKMRVIYRGKLTVPFSCCGTVEPTLEDHPIDHKNVAFQDRWSWGTGSLTLKHILTFCQNYLVFQVGWLLMAVVSQDRFTVCLLLERQHAFIRYSASMKLITVAANGILSCHPLCSSNCC